MSAETESIVLGVIALFAAIGTAVAFRRRTAKSAVACCIIGGGVLLLYGNLNHEAKREAERQAQWRERQERWRASNSNDSADDPTTIVSPNGSVRPSNGLNIRLDGDGRNLGGDVGRRGIQPTPGTIGVEGFRQGPPQRRRNPMSGPIDPGRLPSSDEMPTPDRP